ncbi:class IV adenylate cyclase [Candidatus Woesearchaeota archaeon]|nr:class IV adenylate cyclase [Candidatus Woesearchaeota archaeon]
MKEIEIRILDIPLEETVRKLTSLGAQKTFDGEIVVVRMDFPNKRLTKSGRLLRIRKLGEERVELCYKGASESKEYKIQEETEVITSNFEETISLFEKLGFKQYFKGQKHRTSYQLGKIKFELDTWPGIPTFLEIEAPTTRDVKKYVQELGYTMKQTTTWTMTEIRKWYGEKEIDG